MTGATIVNGLESHEDTTPASAPVNPAYIQLVPALDELRHPDSGKGDLGVSNSSQVTSPSSSYATCYPTRIYLSLDQPTLVFNSEKRDNYSQDEYKTPSIVNVVPTNGEVGQAVKSLKFDFSYLLKDARISPDGNSLLALTSEYRANSGRFDGIISTLNQETIYRHVLCLRQVDLANFANQHIIAESPGIRLEDNTKSPANKGVIAPDGRSFAMLRAGSLQIFDVSSGHSAELNESFKLGSTPDDLGEHALEFSATGRFLVCGSSIVDTHSRHPQLLPLNLPGSDLRPKQICQVVWTRQDQGVILRFADGTVMGADVSPADKTIELRERWRIDPDAKQVITVASDQNESRVAIANQSGIVRVYSGAKLWQHDYSSPESLVPEQGRIVKALAVGEDGSLNVCSTCSVDQFQYTQEQFYRSLDDWGWQGAVIRPPYYYDKNRLDIYPAGALKRST